MLSRLASGWVALSPGARFDESTPADVAFSAARRVRSSRAFPLLREDACDLASSALLGALRPLQPEERVVVVARLFPCRVRRGAASAQVSRSEDHGRAVRAKYEHGPLVAVELVVGTTNSHHPRAAAVLERVLGPVRAGKVCGDD